jgi:hypothetical protein
VSAQERIRKITGAPISAHTSFRRELRKILSKHKGELSKEETSQILRLTIAAMDTYND